MKTMKTCLLVLIVLEMFLLKFNYGADCYSNSQTEEDISFSRSDLSCLECKARNLDSFQFTGCDKKCNCGKHRESKNCCKKNSEHTKCAGKCKEKNKKISDLLKRCTQKGGDLRMKRLNSGVYYFHTDKNNKMDWYKARQFCADHGMDLCAIETQFENDNIKRHISKILKGKPSNTDYFFWIALHRPDEFCDFTWASTGKELTFTDWLPDNNAPDGDGHCGEILKYQGCDNIHWNDRDCSAWEGFFICEMDKTCASLFDAFYTMDTGKSKSHCSTSEESWNSS